MHLPYHPVYIDQRAGCVSALSHFIHQPANAWSVHQTYLLWNGLITNHKKHLLSMPSNMWWNCSIAVICKIRWCMSAVQFKLNPTGPCFHTEINTYVFLWPDLNTNIGITSKDITWCITAKAQGKHTENKEHQRGIHSHSNTNTHWGGNRTNSVVIP